MRRAGTWGRRVAIGCAAAIFVQGIVPASASETAEGWLPPVTVAASSSVETEPIIAADGAGNAIAAWNDRRVDRVKASIRRANGEWSAPTTLGTSGANGYPTIAMNRRGDAVVTWWRWQDDTVRAAYRLAGGSWSVSERVAASRDGGHRPTVGIDDSGAATVIWPEFLDVMTSRRSEHGWSLPRRIGRTVGGESTKLAVDGAGNTFAVWLDQIGSDWRRLRAARRPVDGSWSSPVALSPSGKDARDAVISAESGRAVVTWISTDPDGWDGLVLASRSASTGSWSSAVMVAGSRASAPDVALGPQGNAVAVWSAWNGGVEVIRASRQPAGGSWSAPVTLFEASADDAAYDAKVDTTRDGRAVATWSDPSGVSAARMNADGSWSGPAAISGSGDVWPSSDVAIDEQGNPFAVWRAGSGDSTLVRASGADWGGPFTAMTKPSTGGQTDTTFSAAWSAVDAFTDVTATDVRYRSAPWNGPYGGYTSWQEDAAATGSAPLTGTPGTSYCFTAQSTDTTGLIGPWSAERCTAVPLDDRALRPAGGWTRGTSSDYYQGTRTYTKTYGATLTLDGAQGRYLALLATKCSGCGKVQVSMGGTVLGTYDLASSSTWRKRLIPIKTFTTIQSGQIKIRVVSSTGNSVFIDGLVVRR